MMLIIFMLVTPTVLGASPLHLLQQKTKVMDELITDLSDIDGGEALTFVQGLADKVVGHNYTLSEAEKSAITTIKKFVDRLLADIKVQRNEDQNEVNGYETSIQDCADTASSTLASSVKAQKDATDVARTDHKDCRVAEGVIVDDTSAACAAYNTHRKTPGNSPPDCMAQMTSAYVSTDVVNTKKAMEQCLELIHAWFPPLWSKYLACKNGKGILTNKTDECNGDQTVFEADFCQYSLLLTATCDTQTDCRTRTIAVRDKGHAAVEISEKARAADCEVGHKVKCLLAIFEEKNNTLKPGMLAACKALTPTCPESIVYPPIPGPTNCTPEASEPCDDAWVQAEYSSKAWFSKAPAGTCTPCLRPTTVPPTTAPTTQAPGSGGSDTNSYSFASGLKQICAIDPARKLRCSGDGVRYLGFTAGHAEYWEWDKISVGRHHFCGIYTNGKVGCSKGFPDNLVFGERFIDIASGYDVTCGVKVDKTLKCFGSNGLKEPEKSGVPTANNGFYEKVSISPNYHTACAILTDGTTECWGDLTGFIQPTAGKSYKTVQYTAFQGAGCGLTTDGKVECWGNEVTNSDSSFTAVDPFQGNFIQISAGYWMMCGLVNDGQVVCWGPSGELSHVQYSAWAQGTASAPRCKQIGVGWRHVDCQLMDGTMKFFPDQTLGGQECPSGCFKSALEPPMIYEVYGHEMM